jgi:ABC-type nitrate/sulfonate/bicarbonate transport system substrate-binding protein
MRHPASLAPRRLAMPLLGMWLAVACAGPGVPAPPAPTGTPTVRAAPSTATPGAPAASATRLRVSTTGLSGNVLTPWAAYLGGYFAAHGLAVDELLDIGSSTTAVQSLLAHDVDVVNIAPNAAIEASLKGSTALVAIANPPPGTGFWLYGRSDLHSVEDLRGKLLAANQPGSSSYFAVEYALREFGLEAGRDYDILSVGNSSAQLAALQQAEVQASVFSAPTTALARRSGFVELLDLNRVPYNANGPVVRRDALDDPASLDALTRYLQASVDAIARLRQDPDFGYQVLSSYLRVSDHAILDEVYQAYLPKRVPLVVPEGIALVLAGIAQRDATALGVAPHRYYDNSIVEQLQRSGYIDARYDQQSGQQNGREDGRAP